VTTGPRAVPAPSCAPAGIGASLNQWVQEYRLEAETATLKEEDKEEDEAENSALPPNYSYINSCIEQVAHTVAVRSCTNASLSTCFEAPICYSSPNILAEGQ
jgi:hypothetical protein